MSFEQSRLDALKAVAAAGAELSAERLASVTHDVWRTGEVSLSLDEKAPYVDSAASAGDHYGSHFTFPGGVFLILFTGKSARLITSAFTRDFPERLENMPGRDAAAAAEAANILINPFAGRLAEAWKTRLIVSAPRSRAASPRVLLDEALARLRAEDRPAAVLHVALNAPHLFSECQILLLLGRELMGRACGATTGR